MQFILHRCLQERYDDNLAKLQELATKELQQNANNGYLQYLAQHYINQFVRVRQTWLKKQY